MIIAGLMTRPKLSKGLRNDKHPDKHPDTLRYFVKALSWEGPPGRGKHTKCRSDNCFVVPACCALARSERSHRDPTPLTARFECGGVREASPRMARTWPHRERRAERLPIRDSAELSTNPIAFTLGAGHLKRIGVGAGQMPDVSPTLRHGARYVGLQNAREPSHPAPRRANNE